MLFWPFLIISIIEHFIFWTKPDFGQLSIISINIKNPIIYFNWVSKLVFGPTKEKLDNQPDNLKWTWAFIKLGIWGIYFLTQLIRYHVGKCQIFSTYWLVPSQTWIYCMRILFYLPILETTKNRQRNHVFVMPCHGIVLKLYLFQKKHSFEHGVRVHNV